MAKKITAKEVLRVINTHRSDLKMCGVVKIGLFGSVASGLSNSKSDIDVLVKLKKPNFDNYMDVKLMLERLFNRKVDVVTESALKPSMKHLKEEAIYAKTI